MPWPPYQNVCRWNVSRDQGLVTIQSGWNSHPLLLKGELVQPRQKTLWQNCFNIKLNNYPVSPQFPSWVLLALKACPNKDLYKNVVAAVLKIATNGKQPRYPATQKTS